MNPRERKSEKPSPNEHGQPAVLFCLDKAAIASTTVQRIALANIYC